MSSTEERFDDNSVVDTEVASRLCNCILRTLTELLRYAVNEKLSHVLQNELERLYLWSEECSFLNGTMRKSMPQSFELRRTILVRLYEMGLLLCQKLVPQLSSGVELPTLKNFHEELVEHLGKASGSIRGGLNDSSIAITQGSDTPIDEVSDLLNELRILNDCLMDLSLAIEDTIDESNTFHAELEANKNSELSTDAYLAEIPPGFRDQAAPSDHQHDPSSKGEAEITQDRQYIATIDDFQAGMSSRVHPELQAPQVGTPRGLGKRYMKVILWYCVS